MCLGNSWWGQTQDSETLTGGLVGVLGFNLE